MAQSASRPLTTRQAAVMEKIDRRTPIKVIAQELGVSETRINQHIRALKDIYEVGNLGDLVEEYRAGLKLEETARAPLNDGGDFEQNRPDTPSDTELRGASLSIPEVPATVIGFEKEFRESAASAEMNDTPPMIERAPLPKLEEPRLVPRLLDGQHAVILRLAAITGIAFGVLAAVVLTMTAAIAISKALDGRAEIPVDENGLV